MIYTTPTNATEEVLDYIETLPQFSKLICIRLRRIILEAAPDVIEDWKYNPVYNRLGAVCGYTSFQRHVKFTFFNNNHDGRELHIPEAHTDIHAHAYIRYTHVKQLNEKLLKKYIQFVVRQNESEFRGKVENNKVAISSTLKELILMNKNF